MVNNPFSTAFFDEKKWRSIPETITPGIFTLRHLPSLSTTVPGRVPVLVPNIMWLPAVDVFRGVFQHLDVEDMGLQPRDNGVVKVVVEGAVVNE